MLLGRGKKCELTIYKQIIINKKKSHISEIPTLIWQTLENINKSRENDLKLQIMSIKNAFIPSRYNNKLKYGSFDNTNVR